MKPSPLLVAFALLLCLLAHPAQAQAPSDSARRYFVFFRDKASTPFRVSQPEEFLSARALARRARQGIAVRARDLPVSPAYLSQVRAVSGGPRVLFTSRWLNGAVVVGDSVTLDRVAALPAVAGTQLLSLRAPGTSTPAPAVVPTPTPPVPASPRARYGRAFAQNQLIGAVALHQAGFQGQGMQIAVFDAGFPGVDQITTLQNLRAPGRLLGTRNFVDGGQSVFLRAGHGTACLSTMAGELPGYYVGTAPGADYHLCLTEDAGTESPVEEANWLAAAEYADSAGVDVISSSVGYTMFDLRRLSHTYADLNGRTTIASRAALGAARVGMLVVVSAGNDGNQSWRYIGAPADADSIISVGAVDSLRNRAGFSSYGPTADGRIKPTLAAMGVASAVLTPSGFVVRGNGTSYACPELAGLAAAFWQANPALSAQQVLLALRNSGSQVQNPDNSLGYGIVDGVRALSLPQAPLAAAPPVAVAEEELRVYPNPSQGQALLLALPLAWRGQALRVEVLDGRGRLVTSQRVAAGGGASVSLGLPAGGLAPGVYAARVRPAGGGAARTARFVVE